MEIKCAYHTFANFLIKVTDSISYPQETDLRWHTGE